MQSQRSACLQVTMLMYGCLLHQHLENTAKWHGGAIKLGFHSFIEVKHSSMQGISTKVVCCNKEFRII